MQKEAGRSELFERAMPLEIYPAINISVESVGTPASLMTPVLTAGNNKDCKNTYLLKIYGEWLPVNPLARVHRYSRG